MCICNDNRQRYVVCTTQEPEHSVVVVGLKVVIRVSSVLSESEAWQTRAGGISGFSGLDIVLSIAPHSGHSKQTSSSGRYMSFAGT